MTTERFAAAFTLWALCGLYLPYNLSWQALDPLLLCGCALAGVLFSGPMAAEGKPARTAWKAGSGLSLAMVATIPAAVSLLWSPPRLLLPPGLTIVRALVVAVCAPGAFAFFGSTAAALWPGPRAVWTVRAAIAVTAAAYVLSPGHLALGRMAAAMPVACLLAAAANRSKGAGNEAGVISWPS